MRTADKLTAALTIFAVAVGALWGLFNEHKEPIDDRSN